MKQDFVRLAESIRSKMETRFSKEKLRDNYIYRELNRLVAEWETGKFSSNKTDIGIAAVKLFDSASLEDDELARR
jgi:hypothetical protein